MVRGIRTNATEHDEPACRQAGTKGDKGHNVVFFVVLRDLCVPSLKLNVICH